MSDTDTEITSAPEQTDSDKTRGRIPKTHWAYILGQRRLTTRTLQSIADDYGANASAVHYVVRMAEEKAAKGELVPTLEMPTEEATSEINRIMRNAKQGPAKPATEAWAANKAKDATTPQVPSQTDTMLEDPHCKRLFDAAAKAILDYNAFKANPVEETKANLKESLHGTHRALASIELKVEMTATNKPAAAPASAGGSALAAQRLPELV